MNFYIAPNGKKIVLYEGRVMTFGLNEEQNEIVRMNLPTKNYELYITDILSDIIALNSVANIIVPSALSCDDLSDLIEYYDDIFDYSNQMVIWIGYPKPPNKLRAKFKCYQNFEEAVVNLKYLLLTAHTKHKKIKEFSKKISDALIILSLIRNNPGIKTKEIADKTEMSVRSVQRYIATLQATGEWIDYDIEKRGWKLTDGVSILFGDHLK